MAKSLDHVLQSDGTYKWEVTELKPKTQESVEASPAPATKETKKKVSKKKTTNPLSE
jgi:hypothetical protein